MKNLIVLSCALTVCALYVQAAPFQTANELAADMKHRETIGLDCLKEVQLERAVVNKVVSTLEYPEDQKYKDFLTCSYKKQGYQNAEGKMLYENINDFLSNFYSVSDLKSLDGCKRVIGSTHGEIAYNSMRCIMATLQRIDDENKSLAENKI